MRINLKIEILKIFNFHLSFSTAKKENKDENENISTDTNADIAAPSN